MTTRPYASSSRRLWFGIVAGPVAWILDTLSAIELTAAGCRSGATLSPAATNGMISAIGVAGLVVAGVALWSTWGLMSSAPLDTGIGGTVDDRIRFIARFGMVTSGLAIVAIVWRTLTVLFVGAAPC